MGCGTLGAWLVALHDVYGQSGWQKGSAFHTPSGRLRAGHLPRCAEKGLKRRKTAENGIPKH